MLMFFVLLIDGLTGVPVRAINRPGSQLLGANGRDDGPIVSFSPFLNKFVRSCFSRFSHILCPTIC